MTLIPSAQGTEPLLVEAFMTRDDRSVIVRGERVLPGLLLTPTLNAEGGFTGWWTLTHQGSGLSLAPDVACISCARRAVVAAIGLDWTLPAGELRSDPVVKAAAVAVREVLMACTAVDCDEAFGC